MRFMLGRDNETRTRTQPSANSTSRGVDVRVVFATSSRARASILLLRTSYIVEAVLTIRALDLTQALNPLLQDFAGQIETMSSSGKLSGAERGSLAEALLAVAGPSGPVRVREVLEWLIAPVRQRWVPNGALSPEVSHLLSPQGMAAGEASGGTQGLSSAHWELFHDIQLTERCMRRSLGDAESSRLPTGLMKPVDPPPPITECPAADHMQWAIHLVSSLLQTVHTYWTPEGRAAILCIDR